MELQTKLNSELEIKPVITLQRNILTLEKEKERFITNLCDFIEPLNFEQIQDMGRPKANFKDIIKSLCIMSFNGMSYRRTQSDLKWMFEQELIKSIPPRSTLNDYSNDINTKRIIERLIQISALFFNDNEDTLIMDSTWFGEKMYHGGYKKVYDKKHAPLEIVRKVHIGCLKNSRIIAYAKATKGTQHDSPIFEEIITAGLALYFILLANGNFTTTTSYL